MRTVSRDPLLAAARVLIVLIQIVVIFALVMIGIGFGALVSVGRGAALAKLAEAGVPTGGYPLLLLAFVLIAGLLGLAYRFFQQLGGMIGSVEAGDPFARENADRLTRMGWLSVAGHLVALALIALTGWFGPYLHKADVQADFGFDVEPTGLLLTLVLFILARVFRHGAAMRDELEGTV